MKQAIKDVLSQSLLAASVVFASLLFTVCLGFMLRAIVTCFLFGWNFYDNFISEASK